MCSISRMFWMFVAGAIVAVWAPVAQGQSGEPAPDLLNEHVVVDVGLFLLGTTTSANLNGEGSNNPEIDFNHEFGTGSDSSRFRVDGLWRITPRNHIEFMYFTNSISRTRDINQQINWGDLKFDVGASVTADTRLSVYELGYEFAFLRRPTFELAASIGVHYTKATLGLSGIATVATTTGAQSAMFESKTGSVPAPLPVLGLRGGWAFGDHWMLDGQVQFFDFSYDEFHGYWSDVRAGVTYLFNKHVGVGLGYDDFSTHLRVNQSNFNGHLNIGYRGGLFYLTGAF